MGLRRLRKYLIRREAGVFNPRMPAESPSALAADGHCSPTSPEIPSFSAACSAVPSMSIKRVHSPRALIGVFLFDPSQDGERDGAIRTNGNPPSKFIACHFIGPNLRRVVPVWKGSSIDMEANGALDRVDGITTEVDAHPE